MTTPDGFRPDPDLEHRLAAWQPTTRPTTSRDRMLFAAGAASAPQRRGGWAWAAGVGLILSTSVLVWQTAELHRARQEQSRMIQTIASLRRSVQERPEQQPIFAYANSPVSYLAMSRPVVGRSPEDRTSSPGPEAGPIPPASRPLRVLDLDRLPTL